MVDRIKITDESGIRDLVKTFSTEGFKLRQEETGIVYGKECIDTIAGYDENNKPYSRFTYTETDEKDDSDTPEDYVERISKLEDTVDSHSEDIEANAEAIQELAEIVGGE